MTARRHVLVRSLLAAGLLTAAGAGVAAALGASVAALREGSAGADAVLLAVVAGAALVVLGTLAVVLARTTASVLRHGSLPERGHVRRLAGLERWVAVALLGATTVAPHVAAAAPAAGPAAVAASASAGNADDAPVDPTYLGAETGPARSAPSQTPSTDPSSMPSPSATPSAPSAGADRNAGAHPHQAPAVDVPASDSVVVRPGDTLWDIAAHALVAAGRTAGDADVARLVSTLYAANHDAVGLDPDLITPGTRLVVPPLPAATGSPTTTDGRR